MNLRKFFSVALLCAAGGLAHSAWAQTDVTSQYLTNADFEGTYKEFWKGTDRAIFEPEGWTVERTNGNNNDMSILKKSDPASNNFSAFDINDEATRGKQTYWTRLRWGGKYVENKVTKGSTTALTLSQKVKLGAGVYRLSADMITFADGNGEWNYIAIFAGNNEKRSDFATKKEDATWSNYSTDDFLVDGKTEVSVGFKVWQAWQNEIITGIDNIKLEKINVSVDNPFEIKSYNGIWDKTVACPADNSYQEHYTDGQPTGEYMTYTISGLPVGTYKLQIKAKSSSTASRDKDNVLPVNDGDESYVTINVNNVSKNIPSYNGTGINDVVEPADYLFEDIKVTDGTIKVSVNINEVGPNWIIAKMVSMHYCGSSASDLLPALELQQSKAKELENIYCSATVKSELTAALESSKEINGDSESEDVIMAIERLEKAISKVNDSAIEYAKLADAISSAEAYKTAITVTNADKVQEFENAITTAQSAWTTGSVEKVDEAIATLEDAKKAYTLAQTASAEAPANYTYFIVNPSFESGDITGWERSSWGDTGAREQGLTNGQDGEWMFHTQNSDVNQVYRLYQTVKGLANGVYRVQATVDADAGNPIKLTAGAESKQETATGMTNGVIITVDNVVVTDGQLFIEVYTGKNMPFNADNFQLYYLGENVTTIENGALTVMGITTVDEIKATSEITSVNVTKASLGDNATISTSNPNALIIANEGQVSNESNVVVNGKIANLTLTDGSAFAVPENVTADAATYTRTVTNDWGTIVLPYAVESNENVQFYTLTGVDVNGEEGTLTFETVPTLAAGQPGAFKRLNDATEITFSGNGELKDVTAGDAVNGMKVVGTYSPVTVKMDEVNGAAYYIKSNKFWLGNETFNINPFRAYFEMEATAAGVKSFNISIGGDATGVNGIATEDGTTEVGRYNAAGVKVNAPVKGINIVKMSDGTVKKVLVK